MGPAQCRELEATSSRVWAGGAASRSGEHGDGARGPRCSPVVQARNVRQQPGDSIICRAVLHERDSASPAYHFRVAAIFVCLPRAPTDLRPPARVDCNGDSRTPTRVNARGGSERAADPGLLPPVQAARCPAQARVSAPAGHERRHTRAAYDLLTGKPLAGARIRGCHRERTVRPRERRANQSCREPAN